MCTGPWTMSFEKHSAPDDQQGNSPAHGSLAGKNFSIFQEFFPAHGVSNLGWRRISEHVNTPRSGVIRRCGVPHGRVTNRTAVAIASASPHRPRPSRP